MDSPHWTSPDAAIVVPPRRVDLNEEEIDGSSILFDPVNAHTYQLNRTALTVWRACDGKATTRHIAQRLTDDYDLAFGMALDHVEQLVLRFAEAQLFEQGGVE
jgi:hypothetical protein